MCLPLAPCRPVPRVRTSPERLFTLAQQAFSCSGPAPLTFLLTTNSRPANLLLSLANKKRLHDPEREIGEELGLRVRCGPILDSWLFEVLPGREVLIVTYVAEAASFDGLQRSDEHIAVDRFTSAEIEKLSMPEGYRASIRRALSRMHDPV